MKAHWSKATKLLCLASVLAFFGIPNFASAQEGQGKYVTEATVRLIKLIGKCNKEGFALEDNSLSIGGGWMKQGNKTWISLYTLQLEKGKSYRFIAVGDEDAKDVDLEVHDSNAKMLAQDVKTDPEAIVDFTPTSSGQYTVRIRLYDSVNNVPCVCLAVVMSKKD